VKHTFKNLRWASYFSRSEINIIYFPRTVISKTYFCETPIHHLSLCVNLMFVNTGWHRK